ncbi:TolC family protein [Ahniella affigens]|nr:TolC family protein [Ahniella affigens]
MLLAGVLPLLSACAGMTSETLRAPVQEALTDRIGAPVDLPDTDVTIKPDAGAGVISRVDAVQRALRVHPEVRQKLAALGYTEADVSEAFRIGNPAINVTRLHGDAGAELTRALSLSLTDLLTLRDRRRLGLLSKDATLAETAQALLDIATAVESAWFQAVAAAQSATLKQAIRKASRHSADLADRMVEAGTLRASEAAEFRAEAAAAAIAATRGEAERLEARLQLANWLMLPVDGDWTVPDSLPMPTMLPWSTNELTALARHERLDLQALQHRRDLAAEALKSAKRWRWLGSFELEGERESSTGESDRLGGSLHLELPIFSQGQANIQRADAALTEADAALQRAQFQLDGQIQVSRSKVLNTFEIARVYRQVLLPNRERVVAGKQADVNFMLDGVFELLAVRAAEFAAYGEYLEAVRDYWLARTTLRAELGGRWPDASAFAETDGSAINLQSLFPEPTRDAHADHH